MRIIVLGGAGFIGSHVVDQLLARSARVMVIDDLSSGATKNLNEKAVFRQMDICDPRLSDEVCSWGTPDAVVLLAAQTSVSRSSVEPMLDARTNIMGLLNVARVCVRLGTPHLVFASSAAVYGEPRYLPTDESHVIDPRSPYAISKYAGELYVRNITESAGIVPCIMRFSNVYGPRQRNDGEAGVISIFAERFVRSQGVTVYGDGHQTRDFIYVEDVANAILGVIERRQGGVFNISTGTSTSVLDVLGILNELTGQRTSIEFLPSRRGDVIHSCLDNRYARLTLGWEPGVVLADGLKRTVEYLMKQSGIGSCDR